MDFVEWHHVTVWSKEHLTHHPTKFGGCISCHAKVKKCFEFSVSSNKEILFNHCVKSVQIRSFFWSVFSRICTGSERYSISLRIQSECGKIRSRKIPYLDTFHAVKKHTHHFNSLKITFHNITKVIMTYFHISVVVNDVEVISQKVPTLACSVSFENVLKNREKIFRADNLTENKISRNFIFIWNEIFHSLNKYETSRYFNASCNISFETQ